MEVIVKDMKQTLELYKQFLEILRTVGFLKDF